MAPVAPVAPKNTDDGGNEIYISNEVLSQIVKVIKTMPEIKTKMLSDTLSIPLRTMKRYLAHLNKSQIIKHVGTNRSGHWILIENKNTITK